MEQFVEHFYTSNRQLIEAIAHNSNINTVEEAKTSIENWAVGTILSRNPIIKFSEDGTTATTYAGSDINLESEFTLKVLEEPKKEEIKKEEPIIEDVLPNTKNTNLPIDITSFSLVCLGSLIIRKSYY